jgi:hypothetical protein
MLKLIFQGQRYDVVFTANQTAGNYWFRAAADAQCQSGNAREGRAIFTYQGQTVADPTTVAPANPPTGCIDPVTTPKIVKNVPSTTFAAQAKNLPVGFGPVAVQGNLVLWTVNGTSMVVDPGNPTVKYVAQNNPNIPASYNVVEVPSTSATTVSTFSHLRSSVLNASSGPIG